ncbi:MAG: right-handed parallel beta-helix repeat-containing protein [Thermoplasmata archaeon]|nr:right-handed parallel beta-helix repeat-containing protein [Thermoplasmata archaeon]
MKKTALTVAFLVFLSAFIVTVIVLPEARATTLYVGGGGPGNHTTIQSAINSAGDGDTVFVYNGTYTEPVAIIRPLTLIGEDRDATVIDGDGMWTVVNVISDWVNFTGFTVTNSGRTWGQAGIKVDTVQNVKVTNVIAKGNYVGIDFSQADGNIVVNSTITDNYVGINLYDSRSISVTGNEIRSNDLAGVWVFFGQGIMDSNNLSDNGIGFYMYASTGDLLTNNSMVSDGIMIEGYTVEDWNTHTIDTSNTVNGKPVHYWKNATGGSIPLSAGQILLANCTNVTVENQIIDNGTVGVLLGFSNYNAVSNNTVSDHSLYGISLDESMYNTVLNNSVSNSSHSISLGNSQYNAVEGNNVSLNDVGVHVLLSSNNTVVNNTVQKNWMGIELAYSGSNTLTGNTMIDDGIRIHGDSQEHWNTHIIDASNTVNGKPVRYWKNATGGTVPSDAGQVILANCTSVSVENQNIDGGDAAVLLGFSLSNRIIDNSISDSKYGVLLDYSDSNEVTNNSLVSTTEYAIVLSDSTKNNLTSNVMVEAGIHIYGDLVEHWNTHIIDTSNIINGKPVRYWKNATGGTVPSDAGQVILANCVGVTVEDQHISNGSNGIEMGFSHNNVILSNTISGHSWNGVYLDHSDGNTITENNLSYNGYGIFLALSDGSSVFHNNFIGNGNGGQAFSLGSFNQWDDGYPSGGNYWSDYNGSDHLSGPGQDQQGRDGIGDVPYSIMFEAQDRFPLMSPIGSVPPQPPVITDAVLSGNSLENATLHWSLSPDDGMGNVSVVEYEVYRGTAYDPSGLSYEFVIALPNGTTTFTDASVGEGDPNNYFYQACAVDANHNRGCSENQGAKFTSPLSPGPNLVSVPLIQPDESIETVLQTVEYDTAYFYDSSSQEWKWYTTSKGYRRGLWNMNHTMGLWVNVTQDCNLTVAGVVPDQTTIHLHEGWNLVSFPSVNTSFTVDDLKASLPVERVEGFDPAPPHFLRVLSDSDVLLAGRAYWVRVQADVEWNVPFE